MSLDKGNSPFRRDWLRLSEALAEIVGQTSLSEGEAKGLLCNAIADLQIKIDIELREHVTRHTTAHGQRFSGSDIQIPKHLKPDDFDFENSRPYAPWLITHQQNSHLAGYWSIESMNLVGLTSTRSLAEFAR